MPSGTLLMAPGRPARTSDLRSPRRGFTELSQRATPERAFAKGGFAGIYMSSAGGENRCQAGSPLVVVPLCPGIITPLHSLTAAPGLVSDGADGITQYE